MTKIPKFKPKPGQIDYTNARWAPVVNCVVRFGSKLLLVRRNNGSNFYPGYWNGVSGFLDDRKSLKEKIEEELKEELGIPKSRIRKIVLGEIFDQEEGKYGKTWIVHPVLVEVNSDKIVIDWEADRYEWVRWSEMGKYKLMPGFKKVICKLEKLLK